MLFYHDTAPWVDLSSPLSEQWNADGILLKGINLEESWVVYKL